MADNTTINVGTGGDVIADDDIAGVKFQRVKITLGADGTNDGDVASANPIPTKQQRASTSAQSSVANSATNVTLLAASATRLGATIYNDDSTALLYLKLGVTASTTSYTIKMSPSAYYEVPFNYTGQIDGIASVASGSARITQLSA